MAGSRIPPVWHMIPCEKVDRWGGVACTLSRVRLRLPNPFGRPAPRSLPELWIYLAVSDGVGVHTLQIQHVCLRDQTHVTRWPEFTIDCGDDLTAIHEVPQNLGEVVFRDLGQSVFNVFCGRKRLAECVIDLE